MMLSKLESKEKRNILKEVIKLVQVNYELLPAQQQFLELGVHDSDIDVSLYQ